MAALLAGASGFEQAMTFDPSPEQPESGDECVLRFKSPTDTEQGRTDVWTVISTLDRALVGSNLLRQSALQSCTERGYVLTVMVRRDDPTMVIAQTPRNEMIELDLGDMEKAAASLEAQCRGCADFFTSFLTASLAHEIVHTREGIEVHPHPLGRDLIRLLPSVGNENAVLAQLGIPVKRINYAYVDTDGKVKTDYIVNGTSVILNISDLFCLCPPGR